VVPLLYSYWPDDVRAELRRAPMYCLRNSMKSDPPIRHVEAGRPIAQSTALKEAK
jgi:hypothetical protein